MKRAVGGCAGRHRQFYLHDYDCSDGFGCSTDSRRVDGIVDDGRSGSLCDAAGKEL